MDLFILMVLKHLTMENLIMKTKKTKIKETKKELIARLMAKGGGNGGKCCGRCNY